MLSSSFSSSFYCKPKTTSSTKLISKYKYNINNTLLNSSSAKPYGLTFDQWTSKWRQWAYSIPQNINPMYNDTGKHCAINQSGPVWFLTSAYKQSVDRHYTIPYDKSILFPILTLNVLLQDFLIYKQKCSYDNALKKCKISLSI